MATGGRTRRLAREALREIARSHPAGDLALWAGGATFFGAMGAVAIALVTLHLAALVVGDAAVTAGMAAVVAGLPDGHGTGQALRTLTATALGLSGPELLVLLFPASLYGEGLRRAFLQLSPQTAARFTGWRGRLALLPVVAVAPLLVLALLATAPVVAPLYSGGPWSVVLGILVAFHVTLAVLAVALVAVYGLVGPARVRPRALLIGAGATAANLAGFLQGFVLFLAIPIEWSAPFGGLPVVGAVTALLLWMFLLHVVVLVGYRLTVVLDDMFAARRPGPPPADPDRCPVVGTDAPSGRSG